MRTVSLFEKKAILRFSDEVFYGSPFPIGLEDSFRGNLFREIRDDEFMLEKQFLHFSYGLEAKSAGTLPRIGLVENRVEVLLFLLPISFITNANKALCLMMQPAVSFESDDVIVFFFFAQIIEFRSSETTVCPDEDGSNWNSLVVVLKKWIQETGYSF